MGQKYVCQSVIRATDLNQWGQVIDDAIPVALGYGRDKVARQYGSFDGRHWDVLFYARNHINNKFRRLRGGLTPELLAGRVRELNIGRKPDDPAWLWVAQRPSPNSSTGVPVPTAVVDTQLEEIREKQASGGGVLMGLWNKLADAMLKSSENQLEMFQQIKASQDTMLSVIQSQSDAVLGLATQLERLVDMMESGQAYRPNPAATKRDDPKIPMPDKGVYHIRREVVCKPGQSWDRISSKGLTRAQQEWQVLYRNLWNEWVTTQKAKTTVPSIIVYGWEPTVAACQNIFHHLNPDQIVWIETKNSQFHMIDLSTKNIEPSNGQLLIVIGGHAMRQAAEIRKQCEHSGIKYYWSDKGHAIDTNAVASYWINKTFAEHRKQLEPTPAGMAA